MEDVLDVIITDSSDPLGPAENLFRKSWYQLMKKSYYQLIPERGWHPLLPGWVLVAEPGPHQGDAGSSANYSFWAWAMLCAPSLPTPAAKLASCAFLCACWVVSVVSDSLWPHELYPARFLCPWNSPGKNTGVGCYALLQGILNWLHAVQQISKHQLLGAPEVADTWSRWNRCNWNTTILMCTGQPEFARKALNDVCWAQGPLLPQLPMTSANSEPPGYLDPASPRQDFCWLAPQPSVTGCRMLPGLPS